MRKTPKVKRIRASLFLYYSNNRINVQSIYIFRRQTQRTPEQVIYHDIIDDANAQYTGRQESQSEPRGVYDVLDVTSRDPDEGLDKPYTELTATRPPRKGESRGHYNVLDVTTRDQDESLDKPYTELTTKMLYQNIPRTGREDPL